MLVCRGEFQEWLPQGKRYLQKMPQGFVMQKYLLNFKTFIRKSHSDRSQNRSQNSKDTKAVGGVEVGGGLLISHL